MIIREQCCNAEILTLRQETMNKTFSLIRTSSRNRHIPDLLDYTILAHDGADSIVWSYKQNGRAALRQFRHLLGKLS
jgi:hypothetical protein